MNQNMLLARLTMVSGEVVDPNQVQSMVEMFGYALVDPELQQFSYKNDDHGISDIRVLREGTMIELWGTHEEDAFTLSALAKKLGWDVADIEIIDSSMEQHLLQNFTNLKLREVLSGGNGRHAGVDTETTLPETTLPATNPEPEKHVEVAVVAAPIPLPTTENSSSLDALRQENVRLQNKVDELTRRNTASFTCQNGAEPANVDLINALVAASIDLKDNSVVKKLAEHGFNVRITAERGV